MSQIDYKAALLTRVRRIVVKVGSAVLSDQGGLRANVIDQIAEQIETVLSRGSQVVLVTSGAIAAGRARLGRHGARSRNGRRPQPLARSS